jgi:two-component system, OmpR family, alkaline phosphatase synthesis response regulator PhoP
MEPLLCHPDPLPEPLAAALRRGGYDFRCVARPELVEAAEQESTKDGWGGAVVAAEGDMAAAMAICRHLRRREVPLTPLLLVVSPNQIGALSLRDDLFDDFCLLPLNIEEIVSRLEHLFWRSGRGLQPDLVEYGPLLLNLETYQAAVAGRVLDLTYMEYELLRFLSTHPGKVFTRETLLNRVWGYEYYGGARTVDVHVRRLRAKIGEEHAHLIQTVRSVGYRFGQMGWVPKVAPRPEDPS